MGNGQLKKMTAKNKDTKPAKADKDKLKAFLKANGAKDVDITFLDKDHKDWSELSEDVRQWCKSLKKKVA